MAQSNLDNAPCGRLAQSLRRNGRRRDSARLGRLVRILQLLNLICSNPGQSASQLASQLGISRRTLYRDFKLLRTAGISLEIRIGANGDRRPGYHIQTSSEKVMNLGNDMTSLAILSALTRHPILNELDPYVQMAQRAVDSILNKLSVDNRAFCDLISEEFYNQELQRVIQLMADASPAPADG